MANDYSNIYVNGNGLSHFWSLIKQKFVAKETGKGLSTNDYTDEEKTKLAGIATGANKYTLPTASSSTKGGVKVGSGLSMSGEVLSVKPVEYSVLVDANNKDVVKLQSDAPTIFKEITIPTADVSYGTAGVMTAAEKLKLNKMSFVGFKSCSTAANTQIKSATFDGSLKAGDVFVVQFTNANTAGNPILRTYNQDTQGAIKYHGANFDSWDAGALCLFVYDGTDYHILAYDVGAAQNTATEVKDGLMSGDDKAKLDGIEPRANKYTLPTAGSTLGGVKTTSTVTSNSGYTAVPIIDGVPYYKDTNTTYSDASQSTHGLMSSADKKKLDAFGAASTYALKSEISSMYKHKGTKATKADLPTSGNTTGEVWNVTAEKGMNYVWTGSEWDALGEVFTIETITNTEIDTIVAS